MFQSPTDRQQQEIDFNRLQQVIRRTSPHEIYRKRGFVLSRQKNYFGSWIVFLNDVEQIRAGVIGHPEIQNACVWMKGSGLSRCLAGIRETENFITQMREQFSNKCHNFRVVVDDQNSW